MISAIVSKITSHGGLPFGLHGDAVAAVWAPGRAKAALDCASGRGRAEKLMPMDQAAAAQRLVAMGDTEASTRRNAALAKAGIARPGVWQGMFAGR